MLNARALAAAALTPLAANAQNQINMPTGVSDAGVVITELGAEIYGLHMLIFWISVAIGVGVFGIMLYSIYAHRKSRGVKPSQFHEHTGVEIAWTVIPFFILVAMAVPATSTLLEVYDNDDAELSILVTGYQWKWKYEYLDADGENISFFSNLATSQEQIYNTDVKGENYLLEVDQPLVIPVDTKVRFLITASDVIHSWWVPEIAVKRDAIPGFINEAWTRVLAEGVYRGQCTELCGSYHGFMPVEVHVVSQDEFDDWTASKRGAAAADAALAAQELSVDDLMARGADIYNASCLACHGAKGEGGLGNAIAGSAIAMGGVDSHLNVIVNGVAGTAMQAFGAQLSDVDVAAVTTYQRNAFGNNTGDVVQASDVVSYKEG
ncbi:cytochrome c oxidase subunit II [Luminiphilus sp.]|jgi:cytochrome c oxidase subunit 2|nr:cytochrome c oxidase subunit II [Luminiphilus sp.]MDA8656767.1 cytochrome c oxidase subunit II [Luminiphilus sp.]MDA8662567.1 cytochrome c oxidase subunit II [Luminiphilus sp.]MDB2585404.1 cytochrome c oxidase subunit II [Luminiphilus sp.]MDB2667059.1 cytochrome c oxidase subunit II [Luminiphilus sp.]